MSVVPSPSAQWPQTNRTKTFQIMVESRHFVRLPVCFTQNGVKAVQRVGTADEKSGPRYSAALCRLISWLINWLFGSLIGCSIDWLIGWLVDWMSIWHGLHQVENRQPSFYDWTKWTTEEKIPMRVFLWEESLWRRRGFPLKTKGFHITSPFNKWQWWKYLLKCGIWFERLLVVPPRVFSLTFLDSDKNAIFRIDCSNSVLQYYFRLRKRWILWTRDAIGPLFISAH
jgi:hypothetical protein